MEPHDLATFELESVRCTPSRSGAHVVSVVGTWDIPGAAIPPPIELVVDLGSGDLRLSPIVPLRRAETWDGATALHYVVPASLTGTHPCRLDAGALQVELPDVELAPRRAVASPPRVRPPLGDRRPGERRIGERLDLEVWPGEPEPTPNRRRRSIPPPETPEPMAAVSPRTSPEARPAPAPRARPARSRPSGRALRAAVASPDLGVDILIVAGAGLIALVMALAVLSFGDSHPTILPIACAALIGSLGLLMRPEWIVPSFLAFTWASIDASVLGGFSPVQLGSQALLLAAVWFAIGRPSLALDVVTVLLLIGIVLIVSGLTSPEGSSLPAGLQKQLPFLAIAALTLRGRADVDRATVALTTVGLFLGVGAAYSVLVGSSTLFPLEIDPSGVEAARAAGPFGESNFFALSLGALLPFAMYQWSMPGSRRVLGMTSAAALLAGILSTGSRGGLIVAAVAIAAMAIGSGRRQIRIGAGVTLVIALALVPLFLGQAQSSASRSVSGRATENLIAVHMFADHPLLGVGPDNFPTLYRDYSRKYGNDNRIGREPHSFPLQIAAEEGVLGLVAWAGALFVVGRALWRGGALRYPLGRAVAFSIFSFLVGSLFLHGSLERLLFILLGMALALGHDPPPSRRRAAGS